MTHAPKIIYQIYPRSFCDANGDGVGDLAGILSKTDYLTDLAPTDVWISPCFVSPMKDFGYDIADYRQIDPIFGTNKEFYQLTNNLRAAGIGMMIDQVWAHTSDQHEWFKASRDPKHPEHHRYKDYYTWKDPKVDGTPPNNWISIFGGSAWRWDSRRCQYYLHHFLKEQPALNWHNPAVVQEMFSLAKFWLEKGVSGFRLDAINFSLCNPTFADNPARQGKDFAGVNKTNPLGYQEFAHINQPQMLEHMAAVRKLMNSYAEAFALGEIGLADDPVAFSAEYTGDTLLHTCYNFSLLEANGAVELQKAIERTLGLFCDNGKVPCWAIGNHDVKRVASRWAAKAAPCATSAKRNLLLLMSLPGHVCLYQGDELGLPQTELTLDEMVDPYDKEFYPDHVGRDGARTPMPWKSSAENAGFSTAKPWLKVDTAHYTLAADQQQGGDSILSYCKSLIAAKKTNPVLIHGDTAVTVTETDILCILRVYEGKYHLALLNFGVSDRHLEANNPTISALLGKHGLAPLSSAVTLEAEGFRVVEG